MLIVQDLLQTTRSAQAMPCRPEATRALVQFHFHHGPYISENAAKATASSGVACIKQSCSDLKQKHWVACIMTATPGPPQGLKTSLYCPFWLALGAPDLFGAIKLDLSLIEFSSGAGLEASIPTLVSVCDPFAARTLSTQHPLQLLATLASDVANFADLKSSQNS